MENFDSGASHNNRLGWTIKMSDRSKAYILEEEKSSNNGEVVRDISLYDQEEEKMSSCPVRLALNPSNRSFFGRSNNRRNESNIGRNESTIRRNESNIGRNERLQRALTP